MPGCSHRGSSSEGSGGWYGKYLCSTDVIIWFLYWSTESFDFSSWRQITKHTDTDCIFVVKSSKDSCRLVWLFSSQLNSSSFVISLCFSTWLPSRSVEDRCKDDSQPGWLTCSMQAMALDRAPQVRFLTLWEEQRLIPNFQLSFKTMEVCWINPKDESTLSLHHCISSISYWQSQMMVIQLKGFCSLLKLKLLIISWGIVLPDNSFSQNVFTL